jgi:chromosome segregation ATPase
VEFVAIALGVVVAVFALRWARQMKSRSPQAVGVGRIDPFTLGDPWRRHVAAAISAQKRYDAIVRGLDAGPLRARLAEIGQQLDQAVRECWDIARHGDSLDDSIRSLDGSGLRARLERATDDVTAESLRNQLASLDRIRSSRNDAEARLRVLQTRLGEIPSQAAEMRAGADHTAELGTAVDDVVVQLRALTQAVGELDAPGGPTAP